MILKLDENITPEIVDKLILAVNEHISNKFDSKLIIYLSSNGGEIEAAEVMVSIINGYADYITLAGYGLLCSSAFELFFKAKCKRTLIGGCVGMYHTSKIGIQRSEFGYKTEEAKAFERYISEYSCLNTLDMCAYLEFTPEQLERVKLDKEIWFQPNEMHKLLEISILKNSK